MRSFHKIKRNRYGDLTLPFFGFILVAALTIASLTSISQYNIIVEKLNAGLEEANKASVKYILDNVSDSALIGTLSPTVQTELANARSQGVAVAQNSLTTKIKDLIAVRNGDGVNVFDIADSSITKDASDNVIIQFAVEAQVLPPPTPKYKRVYKKVVAKPFSLNSREVCTELDCPPGDCGDCGACDECTGTCIPDFNVSDGQGGFKNPDTATATDDNIACSLDDPCAVIGDGWETYEEHGITGCIKDNCKYLPNHHAINRATLAWQGGLKDGLKFHINARPECNPATGCSSNNIVTSPFRADGFTYDDDLCIKGNIYTEGAETTMSDYSDNSDKAGSPTFAICSDPYEPDPEEFTIFITESRRAGDFGGINVATGVCRAEAAIAGLANSGFYEVILNTGDNISTYLKRKATYYKADGTKVNSCPLLPTTPMFYNVYQLDEIINMTATQNLISPSGPLNTGFTRDASAGVWTGYSDVMGSGTASSSSVNCSGWTSNNPNDQGKVADFQSKIDWMQNRGGFGPETENKCDASFDDGLGYRFYCFGPR